MRVVSKRFGHALSLPGLMSPLSDSAVRRAEVSPDQGREVEGSFWIVSQAQRPRSAVAVRDHRRKTA